MKFLDQKMSFLSILASFKISSPACTTLIIIINKAHEPRQVTLRKQKNVAGRESFGMKLGTRVFVQGVNDGGLAESEDVSFINDVIELLSLYVLRSPSMT